ncbi:MAG TPA: M14 metallopeptidase family protein [Vicinamibacterales bacterium]|nr:M14 metallopeptidase family protein [Vicinamibacterales bacterium]
MQFRARTLALVVLTLALAGAVPSAQAPVKVTTPEQFFGHQIGADYQLPNYTKFTEFYRKLDADSDRMIVQSIGKTAEGRDQLMAIITAPENHKHLAKYKDIARRLAQADGLTDDQARQLARDGKAVVWIDGGLHATEVLGAQQLMETVYQLVSRSDEETMRFLRDVIILAVHANPDGMELVSDWYMRHKDPKQRTTGGVPRLYQKYIGHDNNRDFYLSSQPESTNMNRQLYYEWFPQIMYNHHQTGPTGTILFAPPFRDPANYTYHPLIITGLDTVGAAMHNRFVAENKPGATMRRGANYSTWWNGGLRTTVYFHNMIGLLTESIGHPTPMEVAFVPDRQIASADLPMPIEPQVWHFRQSIEYSITANRAVLDVASRNKEHFLFNIYKMGKDSIEKGSKDTWTVVPKRLQQVKDELARARAAAAPATPGSGGGGGRGQSTVPIDQYARLMKRPEWRDPRAYVLPADQTDFLTATKFMNALIKTGVQIHRASAPFTAGGKQYPAGSYVIKSAQPFRPHVLDMFEPQDHPNDFQYPGGPPIAPYDNAGWTLAYQMGVKFDRVFENVDSALVKLPGELIKPMPGRVTETANATGYVLSHGVNDAFIAVNRLLKAGEEVFFVRDRSWQSSDGTGVMFITARPSTLAVLKTAANDLGLTFTAVAAKPAGALYRLNPVRIGLWDQYGGSMPSGWVRFLLEQFEFPFEVVFPGPLDAGNLKAKYDVLLFPDGGIPEGEAGGRFGPGQPAAADIPAEFRNTLGRVSIKQTIPQLKQFVEAGGAIVAFGGSAMLGHHLGIPVSDHLVEVGPNGIERRLPNDKFYIPGSLLRVAVDNTHPVAFGMPKQVDVMFDNSPVLHLAPDASLRGVRPVAWFDTKEPLRSGWAWGQHYLEGGVAAAEASIGRGKVFLFGPEITFRAQPHGTFKLLFNSIYYGTATAVGTPVRDLTAGQQ